MCLIVIATHATTAAPASRDPCPVQEQERLRRELQKQQEKMERDRRKAEEERLKEMERAERERRKLTDKMEKERGACAPGTHGAWRAHVVVGSWGGVYCAFTPDPSGPGVARGRDCSPPCTRGTRLVRAGQPD